MRHCPACREEYEDWVERCAECRRPLADGPPPAFCPNCGSDLAPGSGACMRCGAIQSGDGAPGRGPEPGAVRARADDDDEESDDGEILRPPDSETVFAGQREFGEAIALALNRRGIPALALECDPAAAGCEPGEEAVEIVVPVHVYEHASWFVQGFEAAVMPPVEDEENDEV